MKVSPLKSMILNKYPNEIEKLNLYETDFGSIEINLIKVFPNFKNSGIGTDVLKIITDYADVNRKLVHLTPTSEFGSSKNRLFGFYKRFGFVKNKGSFRDFRTKDSMIRYPKTSESIVSFDKWVNKYNK